MPNTHFQAFADVHGKIRSSSATSSHMISNPIYGDDLKEFERDSPNDAFYAEINDVLTDSHKSDKTQSSAKHNLEAHVNLSSEKESLKCLVQQSSAIENRANIVDEHCQMVDSLSSPLISNQFNDQNEIESEQISEEIHTLSAANDKEFVVPTDPMTGYSTFSRDNITNRVQPSFYHEYDYITFPPNLHKHTAAAANIVSNDRRSLSTSVPVADLDGDVLPSMSLGNQSEHQLTSVAPSPPPLPPREPFLSRGSIDRANVILGHNMVEDSLSSESPLIINQGNVQFQGELVYEQLSEASPPHSTTSINDNDFVVPTDSLTGYSTLSRDMGKVRQQSLSPTSTHDYEYVTLPIQSLTDTSHSVNNNDDDDDIMVKVDEACPFPALFPVCDSDSNTFLYHPDDHVDRPGSVAIESLSDTTPSRFEQPLSSKESSTSLLDKVMTENSPYDQVEDEMNRSLSTPVPEYYETIQ